jgi:uncharacterized protein (DUF58 family)
MSSSSADIRKYLDPRLLARISGLEMRARMIVEGFFTGMHHSPHHGVSIEFSDHRVYAQGDDLRHVDWKVFGRTDKYYIKEYEQESNLTLLLAVDCSESMNYRSNDELMTKHDYATSAAAAIAYLTIRQQDSVGLALFDNQITHFVRPANNAHHWRTIVQELAGRTGPAKTSLGRVLGSLAERLTHRTIVVVLSDFFDDVDQTLLGIKQLRYRRHEVIVWSLWDPAELTFPFDGPTQFDGLEGSGVILAEPHSLREGYLSELERFQAKLRSGCADMLVDFVPFNTGQPLDAVMSGYLATRSTRLRLRSSRVLGGG